MSDRCQPTLVRVNRAWRIGLIVQWLLMGFFMNFVVATVESSAGTRMPQGEMTRAPGG